MVDVDVSVSSHLKEELAWAIDKWLWFVSTIMLFKGFWWEDQRENCAILAI